MAACTDDIQQAMMYEEMFSNDACDRPGPGLHRVPFSRLIYCGYCGCCASKENNYWKHHSWCPLIGQPDD